MSGKPAHFAASFCWRSLLAGIFILLVPGTATLCSAVVIGTIGDFGSGSSNELAVANLVKSWNPDFILSLGDNNYIGTNNYDTAVGQFYHEFIYPYSGAYGDGATSNRFWPVLGNHDWGFSFSGNESLPFYLDYFHLPGNERYYTYSSGPVQVFAIDSEPLEPDGFTSNSVQGQWLQTQLALSSASWKLVYFHTPPYSSGPHGGANEGARMRWPFKCWGASAVLSGHDHLYERVLTNGLVYFVNGLGGDTEYEIYTNTAGSQIRFNQNFGAMRIEANESNILFQFFTISNELIDSYVMTNRPPGQGPLILCQSPDQSVRLGTNLTLSVDAKGVGTLTYQWRFNGSNLFGATDSFLAITNIQREHDGRYAVLVSDSTGSTLSDPIMLTVILNPVIFQQPQNQAVRLGGSASFNVIAQGYDALRYQWRHEGTNLPNATNSFLSLINVQFVHQGNYDVRISDSVGSSLSRTATLAVGIRPAFIQQPLSISAAAKEDVTFSISVSGTAPLTYSWRFNNAVLTNIILNQTSCFFTLRSVQQSNAGGYRVGVTNFAGPTTGLSSNAVLTILADTDEDGLPDIWECANRLDPHDRTDADLDPDEDGMTNWEEYIAGTDPNSAQEELRIETIHADANPAGGVRLSFLALSNRTYAVECRSSVATGAWSRVAEVVATSTNHMVEIMDRPESKAATQKLYRLLTPVLR